MSNSALGFWAMPPAISVWMEADFWHQIPEIYQKNGLYIDEIG